MDGPWHRSSLSWLVKYQNLTHFRFLCPSHNIIAHIIGKHKISLEYLVILLDSSVAQSKIRPLLGSLTQHLSTVATKNKAPSFGDNFSRAKNVPWFQSKLDASLTPAGRALFETYSGIPAAEVEAHIFKNVSHLSSSSSHQLDTDIV